MSYLVLARKYRPGSFASVTGQEQVTRTLANAIKRDKVAHAHLFAGPRGVGKTSIARIFAKCLNCQKGPTPEPCGSCSNCREIVQGTSLAVREIDGASHNSVDNVRELIDSFRSLPAPGYKYKIYIIDEVHMLSTSAFNALLKSLEEPPPHTIFIMATTEVHKIPETVISRCQKHDFRALTAQEIASRLKQIAAEEKLKIEEEAVRMIAVLADGSMRDAQSLLDRVQSFCESGISAAEAGKALGMVERSVLLSISGAVLKRDAAHALSLLQQVFAAGLDPALFLKEFVIHWRNLLLVKFGGEQVRQSLALAAEYEAELKTQGEAIGTHDLQDLVQLAREGADLALRSAYPVFALEALLVRMSSREPVREMAEMIAHLRALVARGGGAAADTRPRPAAAASGSASGPVSASRPISGSVSDSVSVSASSPSASLQSPIKKKVTRVDTAPSAAGAKAASASEPAVPLLPEDIVYDLSWDVFVKYTETQGVRMLVEHLKRVSVQEFSAGVMRGRGPEFSVSYILKKENLERLQDLLSRFSRVPRWSVQLDKANGQPEAGSLHFAEAKAHQESKRRTKDDITQDPAMQSILKAFPGSTIEDIVE